MGTYSVTFPNEKQDFNGIYLSVQFAYGKGTTNSEYLAERFREKGLEVQEVATPDMALERMTISELKQIAESQRIDLADASLKADIIAAIEAARIKY